MNKPLNNGRLARRLITELSPKPDIMVLLYNEPEIIFNRKKEYSLKEIVWAMEQYLEIANRNGFDKILTDKPVDVLVDAFYNRYWQEIYKSKAD
jgi:hypothetical protein